MSKEQILNYIDVYDATPAEKRKSKIAEIADGLGLQPWEVAETLKAAGCSVNLQWFNQLKMKAMKAGGGDPDERAAEAAAAAAPADASYLRKIIARQDRQLKEDAERYKALEDRAKELANRLHEKDGEIAALEAQIRKKDREIEVLAGQLEEAGADDDHEEAFRRLFQNHEAAKKINAGLRKELEECRSKYTEQEYRIEELEKCVEAADERCKDLQREVDWITEKAKKPTERHFFGIEGGEEPEADGGSEYPKITVPGGELDLADVINDFCMQLQGVEAYLCGRIIEALWCWRLGNGKDAMRVLGGLISELIDMNTPVPEAET